MEIFELDELIYGLGINPTEEHLKELHQRFQDDFNCIPPFKYNGLTVRVILAKSKVHGYEHLPETFVHLITRKGKENKRVFDRHRANKIHWVRCILENNKDEEITHFKYPEENGQLRDYYWYKEGDFIVITHIVNPDSLIITSFHIDDDRNRRYYENREKWYRDNK